MEQAVRSSCKMCVLKVFGTRKIKTLFLFKFILRFMLYHGMETYGRKIFGKIYSINKLHAIRLDIVCVLKMFQIYAFALKNIYCPFLGFYPDGIVIQIVRYQEKHKENAADLPRLPFSARSFKRNEMAWCLVIWNLF